MIYKSSLLYVQIAIYVQKFPEFHIRIFPGFSGSGFFPEKNSGRTWAKSNSLPIFCPLLLHKLYKQFGLVEECGEHEKCKKHTFLGVTVIFKKKLITQTPSKMGFYENFVYKIFRNSGSGFSTQTVYFPDFFEFFQ